MWLCRLLSTQEVPGSSGVDSIHRMLSYNNGVLSGIRIDQRRGYKISLFPMNKIKI